MESDVAFCFFPSDCFSFPSLLPSIAQRKVPTSKLDADENVTSIAPAAEPAAR